MPHRIERANSLIRQELSDLLRREVKDPRLDASITINNVSTSADLRYARVFISRMGNNVDKKETLDALSSASGFLRNKLAKRMRLRYIPDLDFRWDDSIERGERLDQVIDRINSDEYRE